MPHRKPLPTSLLVAVLLVAAGCSTVPASRPAATAETTGTAVSGDGMPAGPEDSAGAYGAFVAYREARGLAVPPRDGGLDAAAEAAARDMGTRGYFSPVDPEGRTPYDRLAPLGWSRAGQSILHADGPVAAAGILAAWDSTPPYRADLVGDWDAVGVGGWRLADGTEVWVQVYAAGRSGQGEGTPEGGNTLP